MKNIILFTLLLWFLSNYKNDDNECNCSCEKLDH